MNYTEFAQRVKQKYPQYNNIDDRELTERMIAKYPQYGSQVEYNDMPSEKQQVVSQTPAAQDVVPSKPLKPIYNQLDPKEHPIAATMQDIAGQGSTALVNQLGFNLPRALLNKAGYDLPEPVTKVGKAAEIAGGVTGAIASPINKVVLGGRLLANAPNLAKLASKVPSLARNMMKGGALAAAYTPQTGKGDILAPVERVKQGILGAGLIAGGRVAGKGAKAVFNTVKNMPQSMQKTSGRLINSIIKPLKKDFAYGKNAGEMVAKEGIIANNFDDLAAKINQRKNEIGKQIGEVVKDPRINSKKSNYADLVNPIDEAIAEASKSPRTNAGVIKRLNDTKMDILGAKEMPDGQIIYTRDFSKLSPSEAVEIKREIGQMTKWTGNDSDDKAVNLALKKVYGKLKSKINEVVPGLKDLNERYASMETADIAVKYRDKILQRQNAINIFPKMSIGGGILGGFALGNPVMGSLIGLGAAGLEKALASTAFKTRLARTLSKIGEAEKSKVYKMFPKVEKIMSEFIAKTGPKALLIGSKLPARILSRNNINYQENENSK